MVLKLNLCHIVRFVRILSVAEGQIRRNALEAVLKTICKICKGPFLLPATKLWQGNVFTPVCDSVHWGGLFPGQYLSGGPYPGGLCSVGFCLGGGRSLSMEVSVRWSLSGLSGRPPYGNVRVVRILLECILV